MSSSPESEEEAARRKKAASEALQRASRAFVARRRFSKAQSERLAEDQRAGIVAPFVPTPDLAIQALQHSFLNKGDHLCDLGCGDGRVLIECAPLLASGLGVDIQAHLIERAQQKAGAFDNLQWLAKDFRDDEVARYLSQTATVCFLFLLPTVLGDLLPYLLKTLRIGTRVICFTFPFPTSEKGAPVDWLPKGQLDIPGLPTGACTIYEYVVSADMVAALSAVESRKGDETKIS